jgi:hypothetical protein
MICEYVEYKFEETPKFKTNKEDEVTSMLVSKLQANTIKKWVKADSGLNEFLRMNYPEYWHDSLHQHCLGQNLCVTDAP